MREPHPLDAVWSDKKFDVKTWPEGRELTVPAEKTDTEPRLVDAAHRTEAGF